MVKVLIMNVLMPLIVILFITQVIVPIITGGDFFWLFRKSKGIDSLNAIGDDMDRKRKDLKDATQKVDETIDHLTKIKNQKDEQS